MKNLLVVAIVFGLAGLAGTAAADSESVDLRQEMTGVWKGDAAAGVLTFLPGEKYTWKRDAKNCAKPLCQSPEMKGEYLATPTQLMFIKALGKRDLFFKWTLEDKGKVLKLTHGQSKTTITLKLSK